MQEYMMTLVVSSLVMGVVGALCPNGHKKYLRLLCGLCMIALLVSPIPSYLESAEIFSESAWGDDEEGESSYEEIYHNTILTSHIKQAEESMESMIAQEFSLRSEEISISILYENIDEKCLLKKAIVSLSGSAILQEPREMIEYVEARLNCPCEIVYD